MKTYTVTGGGRHSHNKWWYLAATIGFVALYLYWTLGRPLPSIKPIVNNQALQARTPAGTLTWPAYGQAAAGVAGTSILEIHGTEKPVPIASTAKLITALTVLEKKPLRLGEQGPTITLTANDVTLYRSYAAQDGSLVPVQAGEKISQYKMLQAIMLPSSNNMADSLAIWAFGSLKAYSTAANQYAREHGLIGTHIGADASGLSPTTTSTARDLVRIGQLAMQNPVLAQIVGQPTASGIPIVGNIKNVNQLLGTDGIIGIKTGNSDQAGGVFVSASRTTVNGKPVTIVTVLAGSPTLFQAMKDSLPLIRSAQHNFKDVSAIEEGSVIGTYQLPWGGKINAITGSSLQTRSWGGKAGHTQAKLQDLVIGKNEDSIGKVVLLKSAFTDQQSVAVKLHSKPTKPSVWWRLSHPWR